MAGVSFRRAAKVKQFKRLSHAANGVNYAESTREYANKIVSTEDQMEHEYCALCNYVVQRCGENE